MPSLSAALRGLFGSAVARCLDRCLEEIANAATEDGGGGVPSEPSFRTVGSTASGMGAAAAARSAARKKVRVFMSRRPLASQCST